MSRSRDIAEFLGKTEITNTENNALLNTASPVGLDSSQVSSIAEASGLTVYSTLNDLPSSGLTSGDQAFVSSTSRFYISNGSGWYNVALINATPSLTISPEGTIILATDGVTPTVITLTATDSDNPIAALTYSVESDGNFGGLATISQDSSVFTITPLSEDSATTASASLTFKASDGISFGSGTRTITLAFKAQYSNNTTLLVKADTAGTDDQVDASSNSNTITEVGTVTSTALSPYHPGGYSAFFGGSNHRITINDDPAFSYGTGDFTWEMWVNFSSEAQNEYFIGQHSNLLGLGIYISLGSIRVRANNTNAFLQGPTNISMNTWYHIALVRSSGVLTLYQDGTAVASAAFTNSISTGPIYAMSLGNWEEPSSAYFHGHLRDVRVTTTAVYTSGFTPPTEPLTAISGTLLLTCHLPYLVDGSTNNWTLDIVAGLVPTVRFGPYDYEGYTKSTHGGSVYVGGATSYVSTNLPAMNGDWTIEGWFQHTANTGTSSQNRLFGGATNDPMILNTNLTSLNVYIDNNLKITANAAANADAVLDQWYHLALVRETTGNILKLYINGKLAGSQSGGTYNIDAKDPFGIGSDANSSSYGMTGYVADFRVVNGTAVYTSEFTPPTALLTEIANTDLLTCTNKNDIWDTGSGTTLTKIGNVTSSNTQRKFATSSAIYFDGTGDEITTPTSESFNYGTGDFTWEGWVYFSSQGTYDYVFCQHTLAAGLGLYIQGGVWKLYNANAVKITTSTSVSNDTWYHVAVARESGTVRLFVDGTLAGSATITTSIPSGSTYGITLGRWTEVADGQYFHGYMQDVRVTKGLARYTSAFTPPAAEFTG